MHCRLICTPTCGLPPGENRIAWGHDRRLRGRRGGPSRSAALRLVLDDEDRVLGRRHDGRRLYHRTADRGPQASRVGRGDGAGETRIADPRGSSCSRGWAPPRLASDSACWVGSVGSDSRILPPPLRAPSREGRLEAAIGRRSSAPLCHPEAQPKDPPPVLAVTPRVTRGPSLRSDDHRGGLHRARLAKALEHGERGRGFGLKELPVATRKAAPIGDVADGHPSPVSKLPQAASKNRFERGFNARGLAVADSCALLYAEESALAAAGGRYENACNVLGVGGSDSRRSCLFELVGAVSGCWRPGRYG